MTCIAAVAQGGKVWMGGDGRISLGSQSVSKVTAKVWTPREAGRVILGGTGKGSVVQVLLFVADWKEIFAKAPESDQPEEMMHHLLTRVRPLLLKTLSEHGALGEDKGVKEMDANLLVGWRGKLFHFDDRCGVADPTASIFAVGSGDETAWGVLYDTDPSRRHRRGRRPLHPKQRISRALRATSAFHSDIGAPFTILSA